MAKRSVPPSDSSKLLRFSGTARTLQAIVPTAEESRSVPVEVILDEREFPGRPLISARVLTPGIVRLKLKFDRDVPPRPYEGRIRLGADEYRFVAEVQPQSYLRAVPPILSLTHKSETEAFADMTIANGGNGACEIQPVYAVGLFKLGGVEEALGKAYREQGTDERRWIDRVGDNLSESYGGLLMIKVEDGAGPLNPGELRLLRLRLRFPGNLRTGHVYDGKLEVDGLVHPVRVDVP